MWNFTNPQRAPPSSGNIKVRKDAEASFLYHIQYNTKLCKDFSNNAGTNGSTAFTDSETETLFHSDSRDEFNSHIYVIARAAHFNAVGKVDNTGNVSCSEVELRSVTSEEGFFTTAYYDNVFLARRIKCETYLSAGLMDMSCSPAGIYLVYKNLASEKKDITVYPQGTHSSSPGRKGKARIDAVLQGK